MGLHETAETIVKQTESTVRNSINRAASDVRRQTSITGWANRMIGKLAQQGKAAANDGHKRREGIYILPAEAVRQDRQESAFVAPDGYVRKSPVQEIVEDPAYRSRLLLRGARIAVALLLAAVALYTLLRLGII